MMKYMMTFEKTMPNRMSLRDWRSSDAVAPTRSRRRVRHDDFLFHFLIGLPCVQVGRQAGADYGNEQRQKVPIQVNRRHECAMENRAEIRFRKKCRARVSEQNQRQPSEDVSNPLVRAPDLQCDNRARDQRNQDLERRGREQRHPQQTRRVLIANDREQSFTADLTEFRRQVHDREHHRERDGRHPQECRANRCSGGRIGADGRWIVIGRARDETEAHGANDVPMTLRFRCFPITLRFRCLTSSHGRW
jgi:hypothetical protein